MARRRSKRSYQDQDPDRDPPAIANSFDVDRVSAPPDRYKTALRSFLDIEDGRHFHPSGSDRPARRKTGAPAQYALRDRLYRDQLRQQRKLLHRQSQTRASIAFKEPESVLTCVRRQRRKEVLIAKKKRKGRGSKSKFNWRSYIRC